MLKSVYWKPAVRYVIDKIIVFHPIDFINIRRNEVKEKVKFKAVKNQMKGKAKVHVSIPRKSGVREPLWY